MAAVMQPDVTIVIPVYNGADYVGEAIRSALFQQDVALEVIVVDDASTDATASLVEAVADPRVRLIRHSTNSGPGAARNTGFSHASGRWLAVLDADDTMAPDRMSHLIGQAEDASAEIVADNLLMVPARVPMFEPGFFPDDGIFHLEHLICSDQPFVRRWTFGYLKPLFCREFVQSRELRYQTGLQIGEDFIFLADCLAASARMVVDVAPRYYYYVRQDSVSARTDKSHIDRMLSAQSDFEQRHRLLPKWVRALGERRASLEAVGAYLTMVEQVKAGRYGAAFACAVGHPRGALLFRLPIAVRLRRLMRRSGT